MAPPTDDTATACPARPPLFVARPPLAKDGSQKIKRILIANRGEIACRIIATCRKLNIVSIAIYVQEDSVSRHVTDADECINIGSLDQSETNPFLDINLLIDTAKSVEADAVHPGYGYLSENADFAKAVKAAGLIFIGPSAEAMSTLGDKRASKEYLRENEPAVPLIPGYAGSSQDIKDLEDAADGIGYPVMLKASAGGGGKGMRIVHERAKLREELKSAQSEASRSFGSGDCILEKYIEAGKHIEVQIMGDSHGKVVSLWERECSVQRRHQKVIEETPSPWLTQDKRRHMCDVAVKLGELLDYEGAGTVEFVVDAKTGNFYFLEVNTRLQVEHPITEEVTGLDLVALQIFVAAGGSLKSLPVLQKIPQDGHAIECRLCAEDPQRDFFPEHGTIRLWQPAPESPSESRDIRYETAVMSGSEISIYFDSMIAKIVVWAPTRQTAIAKMVKALAHTACVGLRTNQLFLQGCLLSPAFRDPSYTTSFIPENFDRLITNPYSDKAAALTKLLAVIPSIFMRNLSHYLPSTAAQRPFRHIRRGFRNQTHDPINFHTDIVTIHNPPHEPEAVMCLWQPAARHAQIPQPFSVHLAPVPEPAPLTDKQKKESKNLGATEVTARYNAISSAVRAGTMTAAPPLHVAIEACTAQTTSVPGAADAASWLTATLDVSVNGARIRAHLATTDARNDFSAATQAGAAARVGVHVPALGGWIEYRAWNVLSYCESLRAVAAGGEDAARRTLTARMPCKVLSVAKGDGEAVSSGEVVMVVESMKMEMNMSVAADGVFRTKLRKGDAVDEGTVLGWVEESDGGGGGGGDE